MKKLYFIRHGESQFNVEGRYAGTANPPLTKLGRQQAKAAGQKVKDLSVDCVVSSPSSRALNTAKIIAKEIGYPVEKIHINSLFMERDFGYLEGQIWKADINIDGIADVESHNQMLDRAKLALEFLHTIEAKHILVVSHGQLGRALRSHILPIPFISLASEEAVMIPNAEIQDWL